MIYLSIFCFTAFCFSFVEANPHLLLPRADDVLVAECGNDPKYPQPGYLECSYALSSLLSDTSYDRDGPSSWGPPSMGLEEKCGQHWSSGE